MTCPPDALPSGRRRVPLIAPELSLAGMAVSVSLWLVPEKTAVLEGDRVVELVAGGVTIDLEAPVDGRLVTQLVDEDQPVSPGQVLAEFETA